MANIRKEEEKFRRQNAAQTVFAVVKGDYDSWQGPEWGERWDYEEFLKYRYNRANLATPRSFATGFTCFFFTWIGIPLSVWMNCSDYVTSFFVSFLPTLVIYYPLLMLGYSCAKGMDAPEICWIGNVVLGLIGFWILKKVQALNDLGKRQAILAFVYRHDGGNFFSAHSLCLWRFGGSAARWPPLPRS